jgi:hypothetical protein
MSELERLRRQTEELKGSLLAMECFMNALSEALSVDSRPVVSAFYASETQAFRLAMRGSEAPRATVDAFERDVQRALRLLAPPDRA